MSFNNNTEKDEINESSTESNEVVEYVPLKNFEEEFEILNIEPFTIRKIKSKKVMKEYKASTIYRYVRLNKKLYPIHRLIAIQFVKNENGCKSCDHRDGNRANNTLSNIRWISESQNARNKGDYNKDFDDSFVDSIPDDCIKILKYCKHDFKENLYFYNPHDDNFYRYNGKKYERLPIRTTKDGCKVIGVSDIRKCQTSIVYRKFRKIYNLD